ncbi:MAG: exoU1 [Hyphomicrobiales bacterium]|nr:exoU1 [Hyphomicrobiales bacterium]
MTVIHTRSVGMIIAAKDAAETISRALTSAMDQPEVTEIIIVDDGSMDETSAIARRTANGDSRVRILRNVKALGPAAARNMAIRASQADLVGILDADDFLLPGRIRLMLDRFDGCDFLADDLLYCTSLDGDLHHRNIFDGHDGPPRPIDFETFVRSNITDRGRVRAEMGFLKPLISRKFILDQQILYREELRLGEDFALYAEALQRGAVFRIMGPCGYVSLLRSDSLSAKHKTEDLQALYDFDRHLLSFALSPSDRAVLKEHLRDTGYRLAYRRLLDAKTARKYLHALQIFLRSPGTAAYITRELARAKLGMFLALKKA